MEIAPSGLQMLDEVGGAAEEDGVAMVDEGMADGGGEVGLADAAGTEQQDVAAVADPAIAALDDDGFTPWHPKPPARPKD